MKTVKLGDVVKIKNGRDYKHLKSGDYPVYGTGGIITYVNEYVYNKPTVLIPRKGSLDKVYYLNEPFWNVDTIFYTEINEDLILPKYFYYVLDDMDLNRLNTAGGIPSLTQTKLNTIKIPLPPLAEQGKIVSELDNIENLISLLEKETDLRKKQFEYYLIQIFNNLRKHSQMVQLNKLLNYEQPTKYQVKSTDYDNTFEIPVLTAGDAFILGYTDEIDGIYNSNSDNPVIIFDDFTTGFHWVDFPFKVKSSAMKILKLNSNLNDRNILRFLYFAMKDLNFIPTQHQRQWIGKYSKFYIPYPDEETILKVVNNLNPFTDIISLLEQEIKLRKKQLQYYRNKLLTE